MSANEFFVALVSAREDAKAAHAEIARLTAELAKAELHRDTYRDAWKTVAAEIAELRAQEPVVFIKRNAAGQIYMVGADGGSFDMSKHAGSSFYALPIPAAQAAPVECHHERTVTHLTGDGTPVEFCPNCGKNEPETVARWNGGAS